MLFKIFFIIHLFSNVLTIILQEIEPKEIEIGAKVSFAVKVLELGSTEINFIFVLRDVYNNEIFSLNCKNVSNILLKCDEKEILINEHKQVLLKRELSLFYENEKSNLSVKILDPKELNVLRSNNKTLFNYGISVIEFVVNYNKLYDSNYVFSLGNNNINNCSANEDNLSLLVCYCEIQTSKEILQLKLNENDNVSFDIKFPEKTFSKIEKMEKAIYFINEFEQDVYFIVDSSYKISESKIELVSDSKEKILLSNCIYYDFGLKHAKCAGKLNTINNYEVYINNSKSGMKISVLKTPNFISKIECVNPKEISISPEKTKFIFDVDFFVNINNAIITLENEYFSDEETVNLNCEKIEESQNQIECSGIVSNAGLYYVYLNGVNQKQTVIAHSASLSKALKIEPEIVRLTLTQKENVKIVFDSIENIFDTNFTLVNNDEDSFPVELKLVERSCYITAKFEAMFYNEGIYFLYLNDTKQDFVSIYVTRNNFTSKILEISPVSIASSFSGFFVLKVDNNTGISAVEIYMKNANNERIDLKCEEDLLNWEFAQCEFEEKLKIGSYFIFLNEDDQNLSVNCREMPELLHFFPMSVLPSSNNQNVSLVFDGDAAKFKTKINFVDENFNLSADCVEINGNYNLNCSIVFEKEGNYFIFVDGVNYGKFLIVRKNDDFFENHSNFIKFSFFYFFLFLFFYFNILF